ncbi:MAG TPA: MraY family glycosyltransferase [candidate division Zixibacteria bacterium]|nr:MraY family glycosyltransferase [candidate division Zixibacteria bacterium]
MTAILAQPLAYALVVCGAVALALPLNYLLIRLCRRYDILDHPTNRKRHTRPTPNIGGAALLVCVVVTILCAKVIFAGSFVGHDAPWLSLSVGAALVFAVGLIDDVRPVGAWVKLLAQVAAGLILFSGGVSLQMISVPFVGEIAPGGWGALITIFWVALLSNAINLIDGLDGLAGGVSLIATSSLAAIFYLLQVEQGTLICCALGGALIGFLFFNLHPAKLFLGDSGSLLIGYMFAALSLLAPVKSFTGAALFVPLVALAIPLIEVTSSFTRRLLAGKHIFAGDRRHLFHYLGYLGLSPQATVRVFWAGGALFGALSVSMLFWDRALTVTVLVTVMVAVLGAILILGLRLRRTGAQSLRRR